MKRVFAAVVAALALAGPGAFAQSAGAPAELTGSSPSATAVPPSRCPAFPAEPSLPDGASTRSERTMREGDEAYQTWGRAMQSVLECRRLEAEEMMSVVRAHTARVQEYNSSVSRLNQVGQNWAAEIAEFNQVNNRRPR